MVSLMLAWTWGSATPARAETAAILERAIGRGELVDAHDNVDIMRSLGGAVLHTVITTPPAQRDGLRRNRRRHAEAIVDFEVDTANLGGTNSEPSSARSLGDMNPVRT